MLSNGPKQEAHAALHSVLVVLTAALIPIRVLREVASVGALVSGRVDAEGRWAGETLVWSRASETGGIARLTGEGRGIIIARLAGRGAC